MKKFFNVDSIEKLNVIRKNSNDKKLINIIEYTIKYIYNSPDFFNIQSNLNFLQLTPFQLGYSIINNYNINIDYDDVLVELIQPWVDWFNDIYKDLSYFEFLDIKNIDAFFFFDRIQEYYDIKYPNNKIDVFSFINDPNLYDKIDLKSDAKKFVSTLKFYNFKKIHILSSSMSDSIISKRKHIIKHFGLTQKNIIFADDKANASSFTFGTHIDDASHNVINITAVNPYCYTFLVDHFHNKNTFTGKRIIRISSEEGGLMEIFNKIPLYATKNMLRLQEPRLLQELFF